MEGKQIAQVRAHKAGRDAAAVAASLQRITEAAATDANLMPLLVDAARAGVTEGEIVIALQSVWGSTAKRPSSEPRAWQLHLDWGP